MSKEPFANMPRIARMTYASFEAADPVDREGSVHLAIDEPDPKRVVLCLGYSEPGWGFGTFTLIQTPDGLFVDAERSGADKVKAAFAAFIDSAILDHEADPERHRKYVAATDTRCGSWCKTCHPATENGGEANGSR